MNNKAYSEKMVSINELHYSVNMLYKNTYSKKREW